MEAELGGFVFEMFEAVGGADDEDGGARAEAKRTFNVADFEQGPEVGGEGFAAAGVPGKDQAVMQGGAREVLFLLG